MKLYKPVAIACISLLSWADNIGAVDLFKVFGHLFSKPAVYLSGERITKKVKKTYSFPTFSDVKADTLEDGSVIIYRAVMWCDDKNVYLPKSITCSADTLREGTSIGSLNLQEDASAEGGLDGLVDWWRITTFKSIQEGETLILQPEVSDTKLTRGQAQTKYEEILGKFLK